MVYWFGDCLHSKIAIKDLVPITHFKEVFQPQRMTAGAAKVYYKAGIYDFLSEAATQCSFNEFSIPDNVSCDDDALGKLIEWANTNFLTTGHPPVWSVLPEYIPNAHLIQKEPLLDASELKETVVKSPSKRRKIDPSPIKTPDQTLPTPTSAAKRSSTKKLSGTCLACSTRDAQKEHPLFEGVICELCYEQFGECAFVFGEDGTQDFCSICCQSGSLFVCDENQCGRAYCCECIERLCGKAGLKFVENSEPWFCFLCSTDNCYENLIRREDWQVHTTLPSF